MGPEMKEEEEKEEAGFGPCSLLVCRPSLYWVEIGTALAGSEYNYRIF
jgi:hypothetical protein